MRNAFADEAFKLAEIEPRFVLVTADIGNRLFDKFKARFPDRFFNCGVAEANMTGVAAGLALDGFLPVTYTIAPFVTTRCLEQIRVDLCYHNLPVVVTSVGAGYSYASLGATHHACEDIAFLRCLPEMRVICPGDSWELRGALRALFADPIGPAYLRLGKKGEPVIHSGPLDFEIGRAIVLHESAEVALLSTGNLLPEALQAAEMLRQSGLGAGVTSFHTVKPLDEDHLHEVFARCRLVVTIEEHSRLGGLGGAVSEWVSDLPEWPQARLLRLGTPDHYPHEGGEQEYFRKQFGLNAAGIASQIQDTLTRSK